MRTWRRQEGAKRDALYRAPKRHAPRVRRGLPLPGESSSARRLPPHVAKPVTCAPRTTPPRKSLMKSRTLFAATAAWLLVASVIAGCESGRERPPAVTVRVLHAAPQRATVNFLREQRNEAQLEYRQASAPLFFAADEYDFNVSALDATGDTPSLICSFSRQLVPDNRYFSALTEAAGEMTPIVVEVAPFSGSSAEVIAIHAAPSLGPMSVYIEADGIVPSSVAAAGSIGFGESIQSVEREEGTYRLSLTEADNPANVLLTSGIFTLEDGQSYIFAILDPTEDSTTSMSVAFIGPEPTLLFDESVQSSLTVVNAAADGLPRAVSISDDYSAPLLAAVPPFDRSADTPVAFGGRTTSATPAGDTGAVEDDITPPLRPSRHAGRVRRPDDQRHAGRRYRGSRGRYHRVAHAQPPSRCDDRRRPGRAYGHFRGRRAPTNHRTFAYRVHERRYAARGSRVLPGPA